jgi:threonyl-tRNA synthetase
MRAIDTQSIVVIKYRMEKEINPLRHTGAHLLAAAIKNIYPNTRLGTSHDNGAEFAYDFDFVTPIKVEDFEKIEAEMMRILKSKPKMEMIEKTRTEARRILEKGGEVYKTELLTEIPRNEKITFYKLDNFTDLCAGPHLGDVSKIKAFKLTKITGAYWRADEKNKMLTRIYGAAFDKPSDLEEFVKQQDEIKRRDHNRVGREQGMFTTVDCIGQGLPLFLPKGAKTFQILQRFTEDECEKRGYMPTITPRLAKKELYEISGHWSHYKDKMYILGDEHLDETVYALRPMTCPFQFFVYKNSIKSYRDLPCRYFETANLFRKEKSGEMHGLIRVAEFTLSDAHIVCRPDQVFMVFDEVLDAVNFFMRALGIDGDVTYRLSKGDINNKKDYIDNNEAWKTSEDTIRRVMQKRKMQFTEADDDAAYYGPKIDIQFRNVHGKEDTIITAQLDFALAEMFDLTYVDENGDKARPFIVHHSVIGCYERTLAMLIEKHAGAMPVWLSAVQAVIMGITDAHNEYTERVFEKLQSAGIRVKRDTRNEKVGYKIREHTIDKVPFMLVAGDKEIEKGLVSVRTREGVDLGQMTVEKFVELVQTTCKQFK